MCSDHWLPLGRLPQPQRESRIRSLMSNKFYVFDVGGNAERESVIFQGAEISWDQLRQQITYVPRSDHTYIVMTPDSDHMNNMNCRIIHSKRHSSSFIWPATLTTCGWRTKMKEKPDQQKNLFNTPPTPQALLW